MASHNLAAEYSPGVQGGVDLLEDQSSPSSSEGSQTLHGDSPIVDASPGISSPISPAAASSDIPEITSSPFWRPGGHVGRNSNPQSEHSSPLPPPRDLRSLRSRHGYGYSHGSQASSYSGNTFRSSRTWISPEAQLQQEFLVVRNSMRRLFKHSEVAKWKLPEFTAHKEAMIKAKKAALDRALKQKELEQDLQAPHWNPQSDVGLRKMIPGASMETTGNVSRVLGVKTIWCRDWQNGKDDIAPWPSVQEMKWEGDDRAKTNCGRFLPLPREQGAQGIAWAQLQAIEQYVIDQVQCIPTMEDIYVPIEEIEEELIPDLLDSDILEALEESL